MSFLEFKDSEKHVTRTPLLDWEGVLPDMSNEDYHALSEFSSSDLKYIQESPEAFEYNVINKGNKVLSETPAHLEFGTHAHSINLEGKLNQFVVSPKFDRRTKEGKAEYQKFSSDNANKTLVSAEDYMDLVGMNRVFESNLRAKTLRDLAMIEKSFKYMDEQTDIPCKFRPDMLCLKDPFIADYKTAQSATKYEFEKAVARYDYALSAAHYIAGVQRIYGVMIENYFFIVQEKKAPYTLRVYKLNLEDIRRGLEKRQKMLSVIKRHLRSRDWLSEATKLHHLEVPSYAFSFEE